MTAGDLMLVDGCLVLEARRRWFDEVMSWCLDLATLVYR
jgi:hypothetical protein